MSKELAVKTVLIGSIVILTVVGVWLGERHRNQVMNEIKHDKLGVECDSVKCDSTKYDQQ